MEKSFNQEEDLYFPIESVNDEPKRSHKALIRILENDRIQLTPEEANKMVEFLLRSMQSDPLIKSNVLEELGTKYPNEFLNQAIAKNSTTDVCEKINFKSLLDIICLKAETSDSNCSILLNQMIYFISHKLPHNEAIEYIKALFADLNFSDKDLLDIMSRVMEIRTETKESGGDSPAHI